MTFAYMLAPIENMTDAAFRALCHKYGADMTFTEMVPIEALAEGNENALAKIKIFEASPTMIQLIGTKEDKLESFLESFRPEPGFKGFNLNLGCPNPSIIRLGQGCAMIKRISKVKRMVDIVKKHNHPISIKMRLGMNEYEKKKKVYLNLIKEADADFFIVHGRHGKQTYDDPNDFAVYEECAKTGKTIIANGDIKTKEQIHYLRSIGIKGVMIGREAIRNPLIFAGLKNINHPDMESIKEELFGLSKRYRCPERYIKNVQRRIGKDEILFMNG